MKTAMPKCPHCKKNDKVFESHMFGQRDVACVRCKRTFAKPKKQKAKRTMKISRKMAKAMGKKVLSQLLADGYQIVVRNSN
jgi:ribosomal protein S27E